MLLTCSVCGGTNFRDSAILWDALVTEWQLSLAERKYVDRQQGTCCLTCGSNLRSIALATAVLESLGRKLLFKDFATDESGAKLKILEINEAGNLSSWLRQFPGHVMAAYPEVDMHNMPYASGHFDLVVHSDTLEHVANPLHALHECRRVLAPGGVLCYTIPVIVGRLTRSREGLPKSYHGNPADARDDYAVQTEYGCDMWTELLNAGFDSVRIHAVNFPSALALSAKNPATASEPRA